MTKKVLIIQVPFAKGEILKRFVMPFKKARKKRDVRWKK